MASGARWAASAARWPGAAGLAGLGGQGPTLADGLVGLTLARGLVPAVDVAELLLVAVPGGPALPAPGDGGTVTLSAGDQSSAFACTVELVETRARGVSRLTATNGGRLLAQTRVDRSYAEQTAGAIIADLAQGAGVTASASGGETLPRYVADGGRSVLDHVARLAATAGRIACFDDGGTLRLVDDGSAGESVATFTAGETLLDFRTVAREGAGSVAIDGEGASDAGGGNAWAWLRKEAGPVSSGGGSGMPQRRGAAPWVRSQQAATDLAGASLRAQARVAALGRFLVQAAPAVVPGAVFTIAGVGAADGTWRALAVTIRFDLATGMTSEIEAAPTGAGAGLPLGLPSALGALGGLL